jgi:threonyl-tRNA synthetase
VLIEHFAGAFPTWLSPVQAVVLTVTDRNVAHGEKILNSLLAADIRAEGDFRNEKLGLKVREAQLQKTPYMLVIGDKEVEQGGVTPRMRDGKNLPLMSVGDIINLIQDECRDRRKGL